MELKGLARNADNGKDKKELDKELSTVEFILFFIQSIWSTLLIYIVKDDVLYN